MCGQCDMEFFKIGSPERTTYCLISPDGGIKVSSVVTPNDCYFFELRSKIGSVRVNYQTQKGLSLGLCVLGCLFAEHQSMSDLVSVLRDIGNATT